MSNLVEIKVIGEKEKVALIREYMEENGVEEFPIGDIKLDMVAAFVGGERDNICEITVNDEPYFIVIADEKAGKFMYSMMQANGIEEFPLAPLVKENLDAFLNDERDNVLKLEIKREREKQRERMPGHV